MNKKLICEVVVDFPESLPQKFENPKAKYSNHAIVVSRYICSYFPANLFSEMFNFELLTLPHKITHVAIRRYSKIKSTIIKEVSIIASM